MFVHLRASKAFFFTNIVYRITFKSAPLGAAYW